MAKLVWRSRSLSAGLSLILAFHGPCQTQPFVFHPQRRSSCRQHANLLSEEQLPFWKPVVKNKRSVRPSASVNERTSQKPMRSSPTSPLSSSSSSASSSSSMSRGSSALAFPVSRPKVGVMSSESEFRRPRGASPSTANKVLDPDINDIENRMLSRWGNVKDSEYYDSDDEGFEDEDIPKTNNPQQPASKPKPKQKPESSPRFVVREPSASVNLDIRPSAPSYDAAGPRNTGTTTEIMGARDMARLGNTEPAQRARSPRPLLGRSPPSVRSILGPAPTSSTEPPKFVGSDSPSSSGPWNDLWDVDDGATGKSRQSDVEKQAIGQARQKRRQSDVEEGRPLTIDAVAQRFRQRQTSPHGKSRRTLFVATDDPIPSFDALVQQGLPGPDASDAEFRALLLRNVLRELSNRAVESGTVAVELTTGALEVDGTDDAELERLVQLFRPTRVQAESCEAIASGQDVLIAAPTGCGKTLAFLLPLLLRLHKTSKDQSGVKIVVVAPSRELAMQISNVCSRLLETSSFRCLALIGGANINRQLDNIKERKPQIVVGTPGRLAEIAMARGRLKLGGAMAMVVDECDSMLSEPHRKDLELLLQQVSPTSTQVVVASATGGDDDTARQITQLMGGRPFKVLGSFPEPSTGGRPALNMSPLPETVEHGVMIMPQHKMIASIKSILNSEPHPEAAIVFVNEGRRVDIVCQKLLEMNVIAAPLHGESSKADRTEIMQRLATGRLGLVVTTELASRGLDLPILSHVINLDLPTDATHYAHRAGRVGRAGRAGIVISFAIPATSFVLTKFSRQLNVEIPRVDVFGGILAVTAVSSGTAEGETEQLSAGLLSAGVQQPRKRPRSASLIPSALP